MNKVSFPLCAVVRTSGVLLVPMGLLLGIYVWVGRMQLHAPWLTLTAGLWAVGSFAVGWGPLLVARLCPHLKRQEYLVAGFLLNLALLLMLCLALLFAGRFSRGPAGVGWVLITILLCLWGRENPWVSYRRWWLEFRFCVGSSPLASFLFAIWCLIFVHALLYPFTAWDTLMRYALLGKRFATLGALHYPCVMDAEFQDFTLAEGYPPLMPALFGWFFLWSPIDLPSHGLSPVFLGIHLLALSALCRRAGGVRRPELGALIYLCFPRVLYFAFEKDGYVDEPMTLLMTSALLYQWVPRRGLFLSFLSVGLGFWTKFNSALVFPLLALAGGWRREWKKPALACCGAILGLPWMVRNFLMVGDPLYPMLYKMLGDDTGALTDLLYQEAYGIWELGRWAVAHELFGSVVIREGFPLAILLVLVALWKGRKQRRTWALLSMSVILFIAALVQRRYELRLVQFLLVPLCILACLAWETARIRVRQGGAVVLAAWVVLSTFSGGCCPSMGLKWAYWTDLSSSYEEKRDAILWPASEVWRCVNRLPEQAVVLVPDSRLYYLKRRAFSLRNPLLHDLYSAGSLEQRMRVLSRVGITHVAIYSASVAHESLLVSACRLQDIVQWPGTRLVCLTEGGGVWELGPVP